jgi:hypothetical protein
MADRPSQMAKTGSQFNRPLGLSLSLLRNFSADIGAQERIAFQPLRKLVVFFRKSMGIASPLKRSPEK